MKIKRQDTYRTYADIYDAFKGDRTSSIQQLSGFIEKYRPQTHLVLDLACGTGSIAQGLADRFTIIGLDNSPRMLKIAKQKVPSARFIQEDMAGFRLDLRFDTVYCLHNSVNHLLTFKRWKSMFTAVSNHLIPGGLFIFDINPVNKMDYLSTLGPSIQPVGKDYIVTQVVKNGANLYDWDVKILLKRRGKYVLRHEPVKVSSYANEKILSALQENFKVVEHFQPSNPTVTDEVGRTYYVCIKRG